MIRVSEEFQTIQGEGPFTGHPAYFIRLQGCSVGCHWCDTKYTWDAKKGDVTTIDEIAERIIKASPVVRLAVITGGEPLESSGIDNLLTKLVAVCDVQVETSALKPRPVVPFVTYVASPKMPSATDKWEETWRHLKTYDWNTDWLKIVVNSRVECAEATKLAADFGVPPHRIYLMPCGVNGAQLSEIGKVVWDFCVKYGYKFSGRSHVWIHGAKRKV